MTDWVNYIKESENQALEKIYKQYRPLLLPFFCKQFNINRNESIELFQVAVVLMYDQVVSGKTLEIRNLKNYLISIAKHKLISSRKNKTVAMDLDWQSLLYEEEVDIQKETDMLRMEKMLGLLGHRCEQLLELFYYKRMNYAKISNKMGYQTEDVAKTAKYKCIQRLKKLFFDNELKSV